MTVIVWSPRAITDVESIRDYVGRDSPRYADLVVLRIVDAVERLSTFPQSGRVVPEIDRREIREVVVRPYRIVYRLRAGAVDIVTVFHAARLLRGLPGRGPDGEQVPGPP